MKTNMIELNLKEDKKKGLIYILYNDTKPIVDKLE